MKQNKIWPVVRDVVIVWVLTAMGGFVAGVATGGPSQDAQRFMLAVAISNFFLGSLAFTISGCLAPPNRWRHLAFVAIGAWLTSLINVVFFGFSIVQWIGGAIFMAVAMGIGGGISLLFKKKTLKERNPNQAHGAHLSDEGKFINTNDDKFYDVVARELQEKPMVPGLWTKAFAEMGGDDARARALYIKYRVAQLIEANRAKTNSFTYESFDDEYRGEIPLSDYGRQERMMMYEHWRKQKIESLE